MPKRVLHLRSSSAMLGAERVVLELAKCSPRFGYDSIIVAPQPADAPEPELLTLAREQGIRVHTLPCEGRFDIALFERIRRLAEREGARLIHSHGYKEDFYAQLARTGLPLVATNHNWTRSTFMLRCYRRLDSLILRRFDRVIAVSDPLLEELAGLGIARQRLRKIGNGIDLGQFPQPADASLRAHLRSEFGCSAETVLLGMVGGLRPEKAHAVALEALGRLAESAPAARLLIVGDGREEPALRALGDALGLNDKVIFAGRRSNIPQLLSAMDVLVMPSLTEGLPMALLEAMAAGLPAVATTVGDVPRALEDGVSGRLVPPGSARALAEVLIPLVNDPTLRRQMGQHARQRVERQYSSLKMTAAYAMLYDELLTEAVPARAAAGPRPDVKRQPTS